MATTIIFGGYTPVFPQHEPGPAQPASVGDEPQHKVSHRHGMLFFDTPDIEEWGDTNFFKCLLWQ